MLQRSQVDNEPWVTNEPGVVALQRSHGLLMSLGARVEEPVVANEPKVVTEEPGLLMSWELLWRSRGCSEEPGFVAEEPGVVA